MTTESNSGDTAGSEALDRSAEAIEEGRDAAREALGDGYIPGSDVDAPGTGDGLEAGEADVAPRPN
ncbi:MAG TPA: hypothetical protein VFP89_10670 [Propionibacteriaceae bacterium]|nr:hypothetical protein [Propionibacteriaceae bacterium]